MKKPLLLTLALALVCATTLAALALGPSPTPTTTSLALVEAPVPAALPGTVFTDFAVSCEFLCARYHDQCLRNGGTPAECQAGEELCLQACP